MSNQSCTKTISLRGGGSVILSATLDLFAMSISDRDFVIGLVDSLAEYQAANDPEVEERLGDEEQVERETAQDG